MVPPKKISNEFLKSIDFFVVVFWNVLLCSPVSFVCQVFESVEAVPPVKLSADEEGSRHRAPLEDITGTGDAARPSPDPPAQCSGSESSPLPAVGSAEASNDSTGPAAGEEIMEQRRSEISETEELWRSDRSDSPFHCQGEGSRPHVLSEAKAAATNSRSAPEKTNVLKLETEVRNEYFQAPPLGETLAFQAQKNEVRKKCDQAAEPRQNNLSPSAEPDSKDAAAAFSETAESKKIAEIPSEKPGSNSPVRQVLNALQSLSHSRQSPDTAESDDSPSALEMEDIPMGIACVTSADAPSRPLVGLALPPVCFSLKEKMAAEDLVLDCHLDTDCNTSPEGTDLGLSEDEPEMENVLAGAESVETGGDVRRECPGKQVYSVSMACAVHLFPIIAGVN